MPNFNSIRLHMAVYCKCVKRRKQTNMFSPWYAGTSTAVRTRDHEATNGCKIVLFLHVSYRFRQLNLSFWQLTSSRWQMNSSCWQINSSRWLLNSSLWHENSSVTRLAAGVNVPYRTRILSHRRMGRFAIPYT